MQLLGREHDPFTANWEASLLNCVKKPPSAKLEGEHQLLWRVIRSTELVARDICWKFKGTISPAESIC
ncbi:hypothetical protein [Paraburkholderia sp. BL6665CI2N2]|uniref:hypothetical protein n=1 Tax=Paraburkholderia sp. BL6665CI2N2 TaxID=1938806 RepID=UPI0014170291|nr:hypothetical protein [Paraburkholderia sp. BL6665CI2N2]